MAVNLFHSRRKNLFRCVYWCDLRLTDNNIVYETQPSGIFYAYDITPKYERKDELFNKMRFSNSTITLVTDDNIADLKIDDIVKYLNDYWIVTDVEKELHRKESYFSVIPVYRYTITLRKE